MPTKEQIQLMFIQEDLKPRVEVYQSGVEVKEHKHPFDEICMVVNGQLFVNVSGNHLLLRSGDRIEIPSNTRHSTINKLGTDCTCVFANSVFKS